MAEIRKNMYEILRKDFNDLPREAGLYLYLNFSTKCSDEEIGKTLKYCSECGVSMIIPEVAESDFEYIHPMRLLHIYGVLLDFAECYGLKVALNLERPIEEAVVRYFDDEDEELSVRSEVLLKREYYCSLEEEVKIPIDEEVLSVVALEENGEIIDLRDISEDGELVWRAPRGNWKVCRYFCAKDWEKDRVNMLNYSACRRYLGAVLELFENSLSRHIGNTLSAIAFSDICFVSDNRRNWDKGYNTLFSAINGYDCAPYYPCLYGCGESDLRKYKAQLMDCRARMLFQGIMWALRDTAAERGMELIGSVTEPQVCAPSWLTGDPLLLLTVSPCSKLEKSYLYGVNSLEIAAGAADMAGKSIICCDAFSEYNRINEDIVYRETSTAFSRGANRIMAHLSPAEIDIKKYAEFVGRNQSILRHGEAVSEIGLIYPITSNHGGVSLYESPVSENIFEYPETPDTLDYMSVINSISSYAGRDLTVIHPDYLSKALESGKFRILVLPASSVLSLQTMRLVSAFFDGGGKIVGTGVLPTRTAEIPKDGGDSLSKELRELVLHVFGPDAMDDRITGDVIYNSNGSGEAYFLHSTFTGVDRCYIVPSSLIAKVLDSFDIPYDIIISDMPRMESTGALNVNYPEYSSLGLSKSIKGGGMMSCLHKKGDGFDTYFLSNATDANYEGNVYFRGRHELERCDCEIGEISAMTSELCEIKGIEYTRAELRIESGKSILLISPSN